MILRKMRSLVQGFGLVAGVSLMVYGAISIFRYAETALGAPAMSVQAGETTVPKYLNYQGFLRDPEGDPMSGLHDITFRIYDRISASLNEAVWVEVHADVTVRDGQFSALLGNTTPLPLNLFYGPDMFIGVTVDPFDEMVPRQRFASVPYAVYADHASSLTSPDGLEDYIVYVDTGGNVGVGTTSPQAQLHISSTAGAPASLQVNTGADQLAVDGNSIQSSATLNVNTDTNADVSFGGDVGIGTTSPDAPLHIRTSNPDIILGTVSATGNGTTSIIFDEGGTERARIDLNQSSNELRIISQGSTAMTFEGSEVGIGTTDPTQKLDVSGNARVTGNLEFGSLSGFTVSNEVTFNEENGTDDFADLGSFSNRICFLTQVEFENTDTEDEPAGCRVHVVANTWRLSINTSGDADALCTARCLSWD